MKKIGILSLVLLLCHFANAQMSQVSKAKNLYFITKVKEAKEIIDVAELHPEAKNKSKTHIVKALIYQEIYLDTYGKFTRMLDPNPLPKALDAFEKVFSSLDKGTPLYTKNCKEAITNLKGLLKPLKSKGYEYYKVNNFAAATKEFELYSEVEQILVKQKELSGTDLEIKFMMGECARRAKDFITMEKVYSELVAKNYKESAIYINLSNYYDKSSQSKKSIDVLKKGLKVFPGNKKMLNQIVYSYNLKKDYKNMIPYQQQKCNADPSAENYYLLAYAQEKTGKKDNNGSMLKDALHNYEIAAKKKTSYYEPNLNGGYLAGKLGEDTKHLESGRIAKIFYRRAQVLLKKAYSLKPKPKTKQYLDYLDYHLKN